MLKHFCEHQRLTLVQKLPGSAKFNEDQSDDEALPSLYLCSEPQNCSLRIPSSDLLRVVT